MSSGADQWLHGWILLASRPRFGRSIPWVGTECDRLRDFPHFGEDVPNVSYQSNLIKVERYYQ